MVLHLPIIRKHEEPPPPYVKEEGSDKSGGHEKSHPDSDDAVLTIHPVKGINEGVLIDIQPPAQPRAFLKPHVPCDIVLVIDVSGSMSVSAPAPMHDENGKAALEDYGLSVLDLTKHAAKTIISSLNEDDNLAIVTFSTEPEVVQKLCPMTDMEKRDAEMRVELLAAQASTNIWAGIKTGLEELAQTPKRNRMQAVMVLTDGHPTHGPTQSYVSSIRKLAADPPTINTFGFGYDIRPDVLKSIAEAGYGNYSFIPDAGMIGTVFVHAVAHLQTTYAKHCVLQVSAPPGTRLRTTSGKSIDATGPKETLNLPLGNLQFGQSRNIYLEYDTQEVPAGVIKAKLLYEKLIGPEVSNTPARAYAEQDAQSLSPLADSVIAYHQSRSRICQLLSAIMILNPSITLGDYQLDRSTSLDTYKQMLAHLIATIPAKDHKDPDNESLMQDLQGQVREALSKERYWNKWGRSYFASLWNAHEKQLCNSFKDPGPLMYNRNEFFAQCRDVLSMAFDVLPPPKPSRKVKVEQPMPSMRSYNSSYAPCFAASSQVLLADGRQVPVAALREGTAVQTPVGPRLVRAVMKTRVEETTMCRVGAAVATPWHPVRLGDPSSCPETLTHQSQQENENKNKVDNNWAHPATITQDEDMIQYTGNIYSVLLERDADPDAHAIRIGGIWGVTLGHGIVSTTTDNVSDFCDIRAHSFLGDYDAVLAELATLGPAEHGVYGGDGVRRDPATGKVCGFKPTTRVKRGDWMQAGCSGSLVCN